MAMAMAMAGQSSQLHAIAKLAEALAAGFYLQQ